jgi:hypothetical protein
MLCDKEMLVQKELFNITFLCFATYEANIKKTYQGKAPAGLTSENIVVAFKRLAHEGGQFIPPPKHVFYPSGGFAFPLPFLKNIGYVYFLRHLK